MKTYPETEWKHTTAKSLYDIDTKSQKIEVYDDETDGALTLYFADKKGRRWPIRSVSLNPEDHAQNVLDVWSIEYKLIDKRTKNQTKPKIS